MSSEFIIDGNKETDFEKIANAFDEFFVSIGSSLDSLIPMSNENDHLEYMKTRNSSSIYLEPAAIYEASNILTSLKNRGAGWEGLKAEALKLVKQNIAGPLTHVINLSLSQGVFP